MLLFCFAVILTASVGIRAQDSFSTGCFCVSFLNCWLDNYTIDTGSFGFSVERMDAGGYENCECPGGQNPTEERCGDLIEFCCHLPEQPATTIEEPDEQTWDDCGIKGFVPFDYEETNDRSVTFSAEFPWMAMVLNVTDMCAASVLHHHVVMTAAHCVYRFQAPDLLVKVGMWYRNALTSTTVEVDRIIQHEDFGPDNYRNDIALVVLKQGLPLSNNVAPICLPERYTNYDNMMCTVTGWGRTQYEESDLLRQVKLRILPNAQCENELQNRKLGPSFNLHNSFVCAKGGYGADTCIGDGGGPLICRQPGSDIYLQVGVLAAGTECGSDTPALYANVPRLMPWIQKKFEQWKLKDLQ